MTPDSALLAALVFMFCGAFMSHCTRYGPRWHARLTYMMYVFLIVEAPLFEIFTFMMGAFFECIWARYAVEETDE